MSTCIVKFIKMIIPNNSTDCFKEWEYFRVPDIDLVVLQIAFIATALLILTSNSWLLRKLMLKNVKSRPDKLFIILCLSDMGVGAFTVPLLHY